MKKIIAKILRKLGLMRFADVIRFCFIYIKGYKTRKEFKKENPDVKLPPAYFLYETFNLNYYSFYNKSVETAELLKSYFEKYKPLNNVSILDWGCGPGRVIRHLPSLMNSSCRFYGSDYNKKYIKWCSQNIPSVTFRENQLEPPLQFEDQSFDIIYGISIFTHLSEQMHYAWFNELLRVAKTNGILFLTLQGDAFRDKLSDVDKENYDKGNIVVKANTKEGHRTYGAFHPKAFVEKLIGKNKVLEHVIGNSTNGKAEQDFWIIQKI